MLYYGFQLGLPVWHKWMLIIWPKYGASCVRQMEWVIPEKIHTSPTDGKLEIQVGGGVERVRKSRWEGGCKLESSSSGVNFMGFTRRKSRKNQRISLGILQYLRWGNCAEKQWVKSRIVRILLNWNRLCDDLTDNFNYFKSAGIWGNFNESVFKCRSKQISKVDCFLSWIVFYYFTLRLPWGR